MPHSLPGVLPGPVSSTDPLSAGTPEAFELPGKSADVAPMVSLPVPEAFAAPSDSSKPVKFEPPSLPDAKSTFGNEHEYSVRMPRTASRAGIAHLAMGDG
jgi:hypothetical protein